MKNGWAAFQDICNVHFLARKIYRKQHFVQQLPRSSDEWLALLIFICAGSFADEHQWRIDIANSKHNIFP